MHKNTWSLGGGSKKVSSSKYTMIKYYIDVRPHVTKPDAFTAYTCTRRRPVLCVIRFTHTVSREHSRALCPPLLLASALPLPLALGRITLRIAAGCVRVAAARLVAVGLLAAAPARLAWPTAEHRCPLGRPEPRPLGREGSLRVNLVDAIDLATSQRREGGALLAARSHRDRADDARPDEEPLRVVPTKGCRGCGLRGVV